MTKKRPRTDKRLSLAPLGFEEALDGLLKVKPPNKEKALPKERRDRRKDRGSQQGRD